MPGQTLLPWPAMAIAGICNRLMLKKKQRLALTTFVAMDAYLRPGVAISLKRFNLVPPQETDTGMFKHWALRLNPLDEAQSPSTVRTYDDCTP